MQPSLPLTIPQLGHQVLSAKDNFRHAILLRCRLLSSTYFRFVQISFRMLSMYVSQDVRGLALGLFPFPLDLGLSLLWSSQRLIT